MRARVQKWGNSLAVRIPKAFALEASLEQDTDVEMHLEEGSLVITPVRQASFTLAELLEGVTPDNLHEEIDTGPAVGREA